MIFTRWRRSLRFLLGLVALAKAHQKPVIFGNAMISLPPRGRMDEATFRQCVKALRMCSAVGARDPESLEIATGQMHLDNVDYVPDALFHWVDKIDGLALDSAALGDVLLPFGEEKAFGGFDFQQPYVALGGSSGGRNLDKQSLKDTCLKLVEELRKTGCKVCLFEACEGDRFLRSVAQEGCLPLVPVNVPILLAATVLARARLIVSGRYHPSIMASLGGTPPVCLGSNSHKMHSLQKVLGLPNPMEFAFPPQMSDLPAMVERVRHFLDQGETTRRNIHAQAAENARQFREKTRAQLMKAVAS